VFLELFEAASACAPKAVLHPPEDLLFRVLYPKPVLQAPEEILIRELTPKAVLVAIALLPLPNLRLLTVDGCKIAILLSF
jgi:hypothetical protein